MTLRLLLGTALLWLTGCGKDPDATATPSSCSPPNTPVSLPGATFVMGADDGYPEEGPSRRVTVTPFAIDPHEVTNAQFAAFVEATGYRTTAEGPPDPELHPDIPADRLEAGSAVFQAPDRDGPPQWWVFRRHATWRAPEGAGSSIDGRGQHPVVHVSYADAQAYAAWAGGTLPTEAQWEYAARGGLDGKRFSWGDAPAPPADPSRANTWQGPFPFFDEAADGYAGTAPVGCYPPNGFGLYDMTGNVWEWTADRFDAADPNSGLIKGGSFLCAENWCRRYRPAARHPQERDFSTAHLGFRVVYPATPGA